MTLPRRVKRGQVLVMVTMVLFAMAGLMGLAVDLGWSYFTKRTAQAAADAAALAAANAVYAAIPADEQNAVSYQCGTNVPCQAQTQCPTSISGTPTALQSGCLYAQQNGFRVMDGGRQNVTIEANTNPSIPPTAPGVHALYWVTVRATEGIPQLFSSVLGNNFGWSSSRATAGIVDANLMGSLILLNRDNDCVPMDSGGKMKCGVDLLNQANDNQGHYAVQADGGILMASSKHGVTADGEYAGENQGGGTVHGPWTYIRGAGDVTLGGSSQWVQDPVNGFGDKSYFKDPMRGKGQPPPPTLAQAPAHPLLGGTLLGSNDPSNPTVYDPGSYYTVKMVNNKLTATGDPITVSGYVKFAAGGDGFGDYVFYGGITNASAGTTLTFSPGRYMFAGVQAKGQTPGTVFDINKNMTLQDLTTVVGPNSDAGEIFVFTDGKYPGLQVPPDLTAGQNPTINTLQFGVAGFQSGNNADIFINLHGLNRDASVLPDDMKTFSSVILWQDQRNSVVKYTSTGELDTSCGDPTGCPNTSLVNAASTELAFQASPNLHIYGFAYQPRGAFTSMKGGGGYDSPLQLIAGALSVQANSNVRLQPINLPLQVRIVALVE